MNWIDVKQMMPDNNGICICYQPITAEDQIQAILNDEEMYDENDGVICCIYLNGLFLTPSFTSNELIICDGVTHWMQMPFPPKN